MDGILANITQEDIDKDPERYAQLLIGLRKPDWITGKHGSERAIFKQPDGTHLEIPWGFDYGGNSFFGNVPFKKGGRIGYQGGGLGMDEIATEFKRQFGYDMSLANPNVIKEFIKKMKEESGEYDDIPKAQGGRIGAQEGGLMDLGGMEKDYRQEGGFVPLGGEEKADDVPARLSKNEFVFTADAVRAAGGGDIDAGAEIMENVMENLEQGGQVSEESQGLEGARNMFATAQRLEGVM